MDLMSTTDYCSFLAGNLITWRSKKQGVVSQSSPEVEFRALAHGLTELARIKGILRDLQIKIEEPSMVFCDKETAIRIAQNPLQHD